MYDPILGQLEHRAKLYQKSTFRYFVGEWSTTISLCRIFHVSTETITHELQRGYFIPCPLFQITGVLGYCYDYWIQLC